MTQTKTFKKRINNIPRKICNKDEISIKIYICLFGAILLTQQTLKH